MIENGTFADYRHRIAEWVRRGKMKQSDLDVLDQKWAALPLDEKRKRRNDVLEAIKKVPERQRDGKVEYKSKPSDNGRNTREMKAPMLRRQLTHRQPLGSLDSRPDPFALDEAAAQLSHVVDSSLSSDMPGREVPDAIPGMVETPVVARGRGRPPRQQQEVSALAGAVL
jgi:hypothetical protein